MNNIKIEEKQLQEIINHIVTKEQELLTEDI